MISNRSTQNLWHSFAQMRTNSTFAKYPTLPRLPIPDLRKTLDRYLKSLQPFLLDDALQGESSYDAAYNIRVQWAEKFENGLGKLCQERLQALDRASPHNWLDDNFWMKKAYHEWRAPLLVNSNWWLAFHNDDNVPKEVLQGHSMQVKAGFTPWQIRRASWLVFRLLDFKERLDRQELYKDTTRTGVWLRENTAKMFNVGRIPQLHCDTLSSVPPPTDPDARTLFIMLHDWCYAVDVYDEHQTCLGVMEIEKRIRAVVEDVEMRLGRGEKAVPVGVLSSDDRDIWAKNLQYLLSLSPTNQSTLRTILNSLMGLSLDHYTHTDLPPPFSPSSQPVPPLSTQLELDAHLHNTRSSPNAHNRWFDKAFTLIIESNTRAGAMGEHSPCDALVPSIVAEYALVQGIDEQAFLHSDPGVSYDEEEEIPGWKRLDWVVDDIIEQECAKAEERAKVIIQDSDDSVLWFTEYGADWIKGVAKFSPDAYIQMVLQLAWFKTRGEFTATYETALTRMFNKGRTETIRTLTADSRAFVLGMVDPSKSTADRSKLLHRALQTHTSLTREASVGKGIDRHLLGLRLMLRPEDGERCELFEDELFERSQRWKLSTSGLSAGHLFRGTGYSPLIFI